MIFYFKKGVYLLVVLVVVFFSNETYAQNVAADKPLFRDPIYDGAADPSVIWNHETKSWYMFYTNRRANAEGTEGFEWVHGTHIGISESTDNGKKWRYVGIANIDLGAGQTQWAPDVIYYDGTYHMYLTHVTGIYADWGHPSFIIHLTSKNLLDWTFQSRLKLHSDKVIDADVVKVSDEKWMMFYNDGPDNKSIYYAESQDLYHWIDKSKVVSGQCEAPVSFYWNEWWWLLVDEWKGIGVYKSKDAKNWIKQQGGNLLSEPGNGLDDQVKGGHPDVVVSENRAFLFYFTHPHRGKNEPFLDYAQKRTSIQVTELYFEDGKIYCDRNAPTMINLNTPPQTK
ncbi:MAG: family 43 glycosylhydrolase [Bacteroidota bacterium]